MTALLRDLGLWFWRLVPANPILVRVVSAGGRRTRHLWIRIGYLAVITAIALVGVLGVQGGGASSLADLAKGATLVFKYVAIAQLAMVCLLAPIFAAAAINQERDARTYNILLSTPLSNAQIVFGSLFSRMYFVFVLLLAGLPLFCLMMIYGGVTFREIALSTGLAAASALVTGALAIALSVIRAGTRKTIFSFYFAVALYLMAVWGVSFLDGLIPAECQPAPGGDARMSCLAAFHPFLSLSVVLNVTPAPPFAAVAHYGAPWSYLLAFPAQCYMFVTTVAAVLVCLACVSFVRAGAKEGEPTWYHRLFVRSPAEGKTARWSVEGTAADERRRKPRHVWTNAVAWREARTRVAGSGRAAQRLAVVAVGLLAAAVLLYSYAGGRLKTPADARWWLQGMIAIELGLGLLVATNTAATALTREKEAGTLDLLLTTTLVSRDIIWGKMRGLWQYALPMVAVPVLSVLMFVAYDAATGRTWSPAGPVVHAEVLLSLPLLMSAFAWAACMLGLWFSIKARKTVQAVVYSVGWLLLVCAGTPFCLMPIGQSHATLGSILMPFGPIPAALLAISPENWLEAGTKLSRDVLANCRVIAFFSSMASAAIYAVIGLGAHKSMVHNFDMVIRKQTT